MRKIWLSVALALALQGVAAQANEAAIEIDRATCVTLGRKPEQGVQLMLFGSLSNAQSAWFVRAPKVEVDQKGVVWCQDMMARTIDPATCRAGGPPLPSGPLTATVTETLIGPTASSVRIGGKDGARVAFISGGGLPLPPGSICSGASPSPFEQIEGVGYFAPPLTVLDPRHEYLLIIATADDNETVALAVALTHRADQSKRELRQAVRERDAAADDR